MVSGVYRIYCKANGKSCVGQSENIFNRWKQHIWAFNSVCNVSQRGLKEDLEQYELEQFSFEILEVVEEHLNLEQMLDLELSYIVKLKSYDSEFGYNRQTKRVLEATKKHQI